MAQLLLLTSPQGDEFHLNSEQIVKVEYACKAILIFHSDGQRTIVDKGHEEYIKKTLEKPC